MRVAICFYGLVGSKTKKYGLGENLDPNIAYRYYKDNVFNHLTNYDIFIHSQSYEEKEKLIDLYKPKSSIFEKQKNFFWKTIFHPQILLHILSIPLKFIKNLFNKKNDTFENFNSKYKRCLNAYSRWYSLKKVVHLKKERELEKNFKYDLVFLTRLDLAFLTQFDFKKLDGQNLIVPNHNDVPTPRNNYQQEIKKNNKTNEKGISDFWFLSSSKNIDNFSNLYDRFYKYNISNHISSLQHSRYLNLELAFYKYRGLDHEAVRRLKFSEE